jgi:hypothetical protein
MPKVVIAEDEFMNLDMIAEVLADGGYDVATLPGRCRKGSNSASGIRPTLPPSIRTLLIAAQGEKGRGRSSQSESNSHQDLQSVHRNQDSYL